MLVLGFKVGETIELSAPGWPEALRLEIKRTCGSQCKIAFTIPAEVNVKRIKCEETGPEIVK